MRGSGIIKTKFECKRNHLILRGTHFRPQGEQLPIAIISHGFMANQRSVRRYARALAEIGYASFCFDFSGGCAFFGKSDCIFNLIRDESHAFGCHNINSGASVSSSDCRNNSAVESSYGMIDAHNIST